MGRLQILAETIVLMFLPELYWCFHIGYVSKDVLVGIILLCERYVV